MNDGHDRVVVWGNCQAAPLGDLLAAPLAAHGLRVVSVPPVYLADEADVARVHDEVRRSALLITQPVGDDYRVAGCGSGTLGALLPRGARTVRWPVTYHVGPFPAQARGYAGDGERVNAPLTDYHDLRIVLAARRGWDVQRTLDGWAIAGDAVRAVAQASTAELRRREAGLDVPVSDLVGAPDALWTMTHPTNAFLARVARRVLDHLGLDGTVDVPEREYLGQRRAPIDADVATALGWAHDTVRPQWVIDGAAVPDAELVATQLEFYAERPDVVAATLQRAAGRMAALAR
ncbi:WcbI family polysaccharide biosynthesis putative acetyltransferase [Jatrophihabitans fulvus]